MVFILPVLIILLLIGLRFQKCKVSEPIPIDKTYTLTIRGIFIVLIVLCSYFAVWINSGGSLNRFDVPMEHFLNDFGQLIYVPFFFYSGFGIFETYRTQGKEYARRIPLQQILRHFLSYFIAWILFSVTALALKSQFSLQDFLLSAFALSTIGNSSWFVLVMIFLYFFSFVSFRIADHKTAVAINILFAIMLVFALKGFGLPSYYWNTLFAYVFGIWYSYLKDRIDRKVLKNIPLKIFFLLLGIGGLSISFLVNQNIPFNDFQNAAYVFPVFFFCVILVSFASLFTIKSKFFHFLGTNAFWIYVLHQLPLIWLKNVSFIYSNKYLYFATAFIVTIPLAFVFNKVFNYFWNLFAKHHGDASEESNVKLGIVISYITLFISLIGAFVVTPRILEYLGDDQYGLLNFANSITAWLTVISSALAASYIKFASEHKKENKDVGIVNTSYFRIFGLLALIMLVILGAALGIFYGFNIKLPQYSFEENRLILSLLLVSGINVALNVFFSVFNNYLTYKKQFIFIRIVALAVSFLTFACNLIFAFVTRNVLSVSIVAAVLTALSSIITVYYAFRKEKMTFSRMRFKETSPLIKAIIIFSSYVLLNAVVDQINIHLDKTILGLMVNAQAVTDYTLAKYFNGYLLILVAAISSSYVPKIHEIVAEEFADYKVKEADYEAHLKQEKLHIKQLKSEMQSELKAAENGSKRAIKEKYHLLISEIRNDLKRRKVELNRLFSSVDRKDLSVLFLKVSRMQMFITFLFGGGFIAAGLEFMNLWLGIQKEYIYYLALIPMTLDIFVYTYLCGIEVQRAMNKHKFRAFLYTGLALLNIIITVILIKVLPAGYEIWGAFIGTGISLVVGNLLILNIYNKFTIGLPIGKHFINLMKNVFYAGVGIGAAILLRYFLPRTVSVTARFIIQGLAFILLFVILQMVFERKTFIPIFKKGITKLKTMMKGAKEN